MVWLHLGKFIDVKWVKIPSLAALQVAKYQWNNVLLKDRTILEKICLLILSAPVLLRPKAVTDMKNCMFYNWLDGDFPICPSSENPELSMVPGACDYDAYIFSFFNSSSIMEPWYRDKVTLKQQKWENLLFFIKIRDTVKKEMPEFFH